MGAFLTYSELKNKAKTQPVASAEEMQQQQQMPEYDPNNPMESFAQIMGPTPAEREAEERRLAENKAKMNAWVGLFNGLGALGNLYYATKGASYAPTNYNPHQQIEANYQAERQRLDALQRNRQAYAQQLYNWKRQGAEDARKEKLAEAQAQWYGTREDLARQKQELAEFKAQTDADYKKATLEQKNAINEVRIRLLEGQISKTEAERQYRLIMANNAAGGTTKVVTKDGNTTTTTTTPNTSSSGGKRKRKNKNSSNTTDKIVTGVNWKKK